MDNPERERQVILRSWLGKCGRAYFLWNLLYQELQFP